MYNINKIKAHIKMLSFEQTKLTMYLKEQQALEVPNAKKIQDIERALIRVNKNIEAYTSKIAKFEVAPARAPTRDSIGSDDPSRPLIG
jgi:hypothetical protein